MRRTILPCLLAFSSLAAPTWATTKGLNQIVTPDVQSFGILSLSAQQQDPNIANRYEVQAELGLTSRLEVAFFQGYSPPEQVANAEYGILQNSPKQPYLLSVGFFNWTTKGSAPQPYIEGGYYKGNTELMLGAARVVTEQTDVAGFVQNNHQYQAILGVGYRIHPRVLLQLDYQSGTANSTTAGFTYNITPQLQFNPAVYVSNATGHKVWGYAVLTWNIDVFAPHAQSSATSTPSDTPAAQ
ncbi:MAG: hypothetical protein M3Y13_09560 [Armatimonadota bacterium]|nr:hypothetical protein [Armatimonadota bacterium]